MNHIVGLISEQRLAGAPNLAVSSFAEEVTDRNRNSVISDVRSVTNDRGLANTSDVFSNTRTSSDTRNYKVVQPGMFVYNPSRVNVGSIAWHDGATPVIVSPMYVVFSVDQSRILPSYLMLFLASSRGKNQIESKTEVGARFRLTFASMSRILLPVPPLEVQRAIVETLDTFSKLEAELEAELEARKQQYEHYRAELLAKAAELGQSVELGELGQIVTGRTPKSSDASAWGDHLDFVTPSDIKNGMKWIQAPARRLSVSGAEMLSKAIVPQGSLLVTCIGADMGKTVLNENICATNQQINSLTLAPGVDTNFVFHVLTSMRNKIRAQGERAGGTMPIINKSDFSKIRIALPSFEEQQRIASMLDQFDALVNDLSVGLPAELAARRQQYEFYRDKLLTFKELEAAA